MRMIVMALTGLGLAAPAQASAATMNFVYNGQMLLPRIGNGIPGIKHLHFKLSGTPPAMGQCQKNLTVVEISDGAFSLKQAYAEGFALSPGGKATICSDPATGALSEHLDVSVSLRSQGTLIAAYQWRSKDPKHGKYADAISSYLNVEYHVSAAKQSGALREKP